MRKVLALVFCLVAAGQVAAQESPRAVIEKAIQAHGGADQLRKARMLVRSFKGEIFSFGATVPFSGDVTMSLPEQCRWSFEVKAGGQGVPVSLAINRDKGWRSGGGAVKEMTKQELDEQREEAYTIWVCTLTPLLDKPFELAPLPETKVNGEPALGVKVTNKGHADIKLFFNKQTGLLVKAERRGTEAGLEVAKEYLFSEHKDFDGVKLPTKNVEMSNGKKVADWTATGYKFMSRVDDNLFSRP